MDKKEVLGEYYELHIIPDRVLQTGKQSGVCQILKVCKEGAHVSSVNTRSQNSFRYNTVKVVIFARVIFRASSIFDIFARF